MNLPSLPSPTKLLRALAIILTLVILVDVLTPLVFGVLYLIIFATLMLTLVYWVAYEFFRSRRFPSKAIPLSASITAIGGFDIGIRDVTVSWQIGGSSYHSTKVFPSSIVEQLFIGQPVVVMIDLAFPSIAEWSGFPSVPTNPDSKVEKNQGTNTPPTKPASATPYLLSIVLIAGAIWPCWIGYDTHSKWKEFNLLLEQQGEDVPGSIVSGQKVKQSTGGFPSGTTCSLEVTYRERLHKTPTTRTFYVSEDYFDSKGSGNKIIDSNVTVTYVPRRSAAKLKGSDITFPDYIIYFVISGIMLIFGVNELRSRLENRRKRKTELS